MPHNVSPVATVYEYKLGIKVYGVNILFVHIEQILLMQLVCPINLVIGKIFVKDKKLSSIESDFNQSLGVCRFEEWTVLSNSFHFEFSLFR
jgi:hypothetical protein